MSRKWPRRRAKARSDLPRARNGNRRRRSRSVGCAPTTGKCSACIKGSRHLGAQTRPTDTLSPLLVGWGARRQHETKVDSEAGMLSGVSRKRSIRSNPCWFTEFCKSQCLSHFAAPFIVVRAETSVAESCKEAITVWRVPPTGRRDNTLH
jgi:hypothetical protein